MSEPTEETQQAETLCGDPDCPVCADSSRGTCADGFLNFMDEITGGDEDGE